jgi:hypothetical protein
VLFEEIIIRTVVLEEIISIVLFEETIIRTDNINKSPSNTTSILY